MKYRPEIDGLRALAVLPVMLFHAGWTLFSGGFVGVDVFFVISGYLITSIILADVEAGRFSFLHFYERRARRILPALLLVLGISAACAWYTLLPGDMYGFAKSLLGNSVFASNFVFWREAGYFDAPSELKPLLHTWSLAVEEQYYLLFPSALLVAWKLGKQWKWYLLLALAGASFALAQWTSDVNPDSAFFLLPFRFWELAVGCLVALWLRGDLDLEHRGNEWLALSGLAMIAVPVFVYDSRTPFPGVYALAPTLGTALVLRYAQPGGQLARHLSARPLVLLGLISYSAYLWHQPILAFARQRSLDPLPDLYRLALLALALGLAYLSWRFVEVPARDSARIGRRAIFATSFLGLAALAVFGWLGVRTAGFLHREIDPRLPADYAAQSWIDWRDTTGVDGQCISGTGDFVGYCHSHTSLGGRRMLLVGDSHSADFLVPFRRFAAAHQVDAWQMSVGGCPFLPVLFEELPNCRRARSALEALVDRVKPEVVILVLAMDGYFEGLDQRELERNLASLARLVGQMNHQGAHVVVFLPRHRFNVDPVRATVLGRQAQIRLANQEENARTSRILERMSHSVPFEVFDPRPSLIRAGCGAVECFNGHTHGNEPLYRDSNHLTSRGADVVFAEFARTPSLLPGPETKTPPR